MTLSDSALSYPISAGLLAIVGGIVLKIVEKFLSEDSDELKTNIELRRELREEVNALREEYNRVSAELSEWKTKYFEQMEEISQLHARNIELESKIEANINLIKSLQDELEEYKKISNEHRCKEPTE